MFAHSVVYVATSLQPNGPKTGCGTGLFISPNQLLTAWHLVENQCNTSSCDGVSLFSSGSIGERPQTRINIVEMRVQRLYAGLDLVVLETDPMVAAVKSSIEVNPHMTDEDELILLGFPGCSALELARGKVQASNNLYFSTTLAGAPGSSGGPIFDRHNRLAAVAVQATSATAALYSRLGGRRFELLGVRGNVIQKLLSTEDPAESIITQAALLNQHYRDVLVPLHGIDQFMATLRFLGRVEQLLRQIDLYGGPTMTSDSNPLTQGSSNTLTELRLLSATYRSERIYIERTTWLLAVGVIVGFVAWCISLVWVWRRTKRGFIGRLIITTSVALFLWPFSLLLFQWRRRQNHHGA